MDENKQRVVTEGMSGIWVVALCEGSSGVIGRVYGQKKELDEAIRNEIWSKPLVILKPAFDYYSAPSRSPAFDRQGRPIAGPDGMPQFQMSRVPVVTGLEFTLESVPVGVRWTKLFFFDDLSTNDRKAYEEFVSVACQRNLEIRSEKLGLIIESASALAGNGGGGIPHLTADMRDLRKQV